MLKITGGIVAILVTALLCSAAGMAAGRIRSDDMATIAALLAGSAAVAQALFAGIALISLRFSRIAAEAANKTLAHQQDTAERQLRAYVHVKGVNIKTLEVGKYVRIQIELENGGATPAVRARSHIIARIALRGAPPSDAPKIVPTEGTHIGPGASAFVNVVLPWKPSEEGLRLLVRGRARIHVYGETLYDDIYGNTRRTAFHRVLRSDRVRTLEAKMTVYFDGDNAMT